MEGISATNHEPASVQSSSHLIQNVNSVVLSTNITLGVLSTLGMDYYGFCGCTSNFYILF